nr:hypothetical protein BJQ95_00159 [Cryobacterium sp. SO1]
MLVHAAGRGAQARFERVVDPAHVFPVRLEVAHVLQRDARVALGVHERGHERRGRGLAGGAAHRGAGHVHSVGAGAGRREQRRQLAAGGVVGVHVHRQVEAFAERRDELLGRGRTQQPGHVLDGQDVRARRHDLVGQAQVVVQGVEVLGRVEQVTGVADRDLGNTGAGVQHRVDGRAHLVDVVEGVEDAEDVDTGVAGLADEGIRYLGGVGGVAHRVAAAQQHLDVDVGQGLPQGAEALPRVFAEEAQCDVVGGTSPGLDREQLGGQPGDVRGDGDEVLGAHPGGQERLVGVTESGVGDGQSGLRAQGAGEADRAEQLQLLPGALGCRHGEVDLRQLLGRVQQGDRHAVGLVDGDIGQPVEDLRAAVLGGSSAQQLRALFDERGAQVAGCEVGVFEHGLQERDVRGDAADAELGQGTLGTGDRRGIVAAAAGELGEHRVEVRADLGARVDSAAVQADAGAAGRAIGGDLAGVGAEPAGGVFGGDPALQGETAQLDRVLAEAQVGEGLPRGDADLGLHEVDVGDLFGDGVLNLDARVHLDEHVLAGALAHGVEQELDGAGVDVADRPGEGDGILVQALADLFGQVGGRRDLDDLLVTPLHGAVPLEQVHGLAGGIREDLHLDVAGAEHGLLEEHGGIAEGAVGLPHGFFERTAQVGHRGDAAHAAPATAGDGLGEDRETDLLGGRDELLDVARRCAGLEDRNTGGDGVFLGGDLVAGHFEHVRARADEGDAGGLGRFGELGVLGEESVAGVDGVGAALPGHPDDLGDIQVGAHRVTRFADLVGLVGLQPVQRVTVFEREDRDGFRSQFIGGAECADCYLSTVGDEDFSEHRDLSIRERRTADG